MANNNNNNNNGIQDSDYLVEKEDDPVLIMADAHSAHHKSSTMIAIKDFVAGTCAGISGKLVEYPFDTIKVRLQMATIGSTDGIRSIAMQIFRTQGALAFYKGVGSPICGAAAENAALFTSYGQTTRLLMRGEDGEVPIHKVLMAGMVAGVVVSTILTPVELVKCRMQAQTDTSRRQAYRSTFHCLVQTIKDEGVVKGLFKGHTATLMREIPGNAGWFGTYETCCRLMTPEGKTRKDLHPAKVAASGALGGMVYWSAFYPADVIKSKLQTGVLPEGTSVAEAFKMIMKTEGIKGFYRGIGVTLLRAVPANAIIFSTYEGLIRLMGAT